MKENQNWKKPFGPALSWVLSSQYFLYFGAMGILLPYFNLYCYRIGFTEKEIGYISGTRSGAFVIFPLLWAVFADRFNIRKSFYLLFTLLSAIFWSGYLFTREFTVFLWVTVFFSIFYAPVISFLEAFTMDILGKEKKRYGRVRVWGTIAFIAISTGFGRVIEIWDIRIILYAILVIAVVRGIFALGLPSIRTERTQPYFTAAKKLVNRKVVVFLAAAFLMLLSHSTYYGFLSIHLEKLGVSPRWIGLTWALASIFEMGVMMSSGRIFKRFTTDQVLIFSFGAAGIRWAILGVSESFPVIFASQVLHAATYACFHIASILHIDSLTGKETKTLGQSLNNAMTYGLGLMAGFWLSGIFIETYDTYTVFSACAGVALLAGGLFIFFGRENVA